MAARKTNRPSKTNVVIMSFSDVVKPVSMMIDFLITIDTTPSMQSFQLLARSNAEALVRDLKATFPNCRIGIIFNGDLFDDPQFDRRGKYMLASLQPTDNLAEIVKFLKYTPSTDLARGRAVYQEILWQANNGILWRNSAARMMIMIGDTWPNDRLDYQAVKRDYLDAREELKKAAKNGIKIHAVHCPTYTMDFVFWKELPINGGKYIPLAQFRESIDVIKAAALNEAGSDILSAFEEFLRQNHRYTRSMDVVFSSLTGKAAKVKKSALTAVLPSKFQLFEIGEDDCEADGKIAIRDFVENQGYRFEKGRGFYELARRETIQDYKEIVVIDRDTGDMFTGEDNIRYLLNIPIHTAKVRLRDIKNIDKYHIFVQSTSVNRRLILGAYFLYNIEYLQPK